MRIRLTRRLETEFGNCCSDFGLTRVQLTKLA